MIPNSDYKVCLTLMILLFYAIVKAPLTPLTMPATLCVECYKKQDIIIKQIAAFPEVCNE